MLSLGQLNMGNGQNEGSTGYVNTAIKALLAAAACILMYFTYIHAELHRVLGYIVTCGVQS